MAALRTQETELFNTVFTVMDKVKEITVDQVDTAQDAMLNLRIDWETLETTLRSRRVDGFEPVVSAMKQLAATAISMAAVMQAKITNQRIKQMEQEDRDEVAEELAVYNKCQPTKSAAKRPTKQRRCVR